MATTPPAHSLAFSGVSLKGSAPSQEDAFYVDPQSGALLLMDAAGSSELASRSLIKETLASFIQVNRAGDNLSLWLENWNRSIFHAMNGKRLEERATASILVARLRDANTWEFVLLGRLSLFQITPSGSHPIFLSQSAFPLDSLGVREKCQPFVGAYTSAPGDWLVAGSGDFATAQFLANLDGIRDFILSSDATVPEFRNSAQRYTENQMLSPQGNASLIWLGLR